MNTVNGRSAPANEPQPATDIGDTTQWLLQGATRHKPNFAPDKTDSQTAVGGKSELKVSQKLEAG